MRRFATLLLDDEKAGSAVTSALLWQSVCGEESDVWEVFQCHKGVIPDLDQILGSAGILVTGSSSCVESLDPKTLQCLSSLLARAIEDERLLILATGGGAEIIAAVARRENPSFTTSTYDAPLASPSSTTPLTADSKGQVRLLEGALLTDLASTMPWLDELDLANLADMPESSPIGRIDHCGMTAPEAGMPVLATGTAGDLCDTAVSWLVKPNVLIITAVLHCRNKSATGNPGDASSCPEQRVAETLSHLARQFMASRISGGDRWAGLLGPSQVQQHLDGGNADCLDDAAGAVARRKHEAGLHDRICLGFLSPGKRVNRDIDACISGDNVAVVAYRPDFLSTQTELEEKSQALSKALICAFDVEVRNGGANLKLMGDEAAVVASEYQGLDGQVKGLLAFVEALQHKKRTMEGDIAQLDRIEVQVERLEHLVQQLDTVSCDLEQLCCHGVGDDESSECPRQF